MFSKRTELIDTHTHPRKKYHECVFPLAAGMDDTWVVCILKNKPRAVFSRVSIFCASLI